MWHVKKLRTRGNSGEQWLTGVGDVYHKESSRARAEVFEGGKLKSFDEYLFGRCPLVDVKVKVTREGVLIPEELFREMMSAYVKVEQVLATLETLADEEALKTIAKSREEVARGEYVECSIDDLERVLK